MSAKFINEKRQKIAGKISEIAELFVSCNSIKELNDTAAAYLVEMHWPEVKKRFAAAAKRIEAVEINKNFNNN